MKHLPGKNNPCDYGSRHPLPVENLEDEDQIKLGLDTGKEIYVRKLFISTEDSARAVSLHWRTSNRLHLVIPPTNN